MFRALNLCQEQSFLTTISNEYADNVTLTYLSGNNALQPYFPPISRVIHRVAKARK